MAPIAPITPPPVMAPMAPIAPPPVMAPTIPTPMTTGGIGAA
jgi:hypothetical protein